MSVAHELHSRASLRRKWGHMHIKGLIMEDSQGKEFVMLCDSPENSMGKIFSLRGWQRRRLVPLRYTERERQQVVTATLLSLSHLLENIQRFGG